MVAEASPLSYDDPLISTTRINMHLTIHPENPQPRLIQQAALALKKGSVIAYPTDSAYALGCHIGDVDAMERLRKIRGVDQTHFLTLVCRDISEIAKYGLVENWVFKLIKKHTPGPYTFVLKASSEVPKRLLHPKRKEIGVRIPNNPIALAILEALDEPILSTTLILPNEIEPLWESDSILDRMPSLVDMIIDGGDCSSTPTSVIDLSKASPHILREGAGDISFFIE